MAATEDVQQMALSRLVACRACGLHVPLLRLDPAALQQGLHLTARCLHLGDDAADVGGEVAEVKHHALHLATLPVHQLELDALQQSLCKGEDAGLRDVQVPHISMKCIMRP